jgi:hypothetical protein
VGAAALAFNTSGNNDTAIGVQALQSNGIGTGNTAIGRNALINNLNGFYNTVVGASAGTNITSGYSNTILGQGAGNNIVASTGNIIIGEGVSGDDHGDHTYIRNINNTVITTGYYVGVNAEGLLGHSSSSRRYKEDIKPMDKASEALFALKPVTFRYKKEIDQIQSPAFGLIAEEVAEVNPHLVARNSKGQPESVHYEMVNAMLLNEFLKEHKTVQEQGATIARLEKQIETLTAGLQRVSAQLEVGKATPRTVLNNQ